MFIHHRYHKGEKQPFTFSLHASRILKLEEHYHVQHTVCPKLDPQSFYYAAAKFDLSGALQSCCLLVKTTTGEYFPPALFK